MGDPSPVPTVPAVDDTLVGCEKCQREFNSYRWRIVKTGEGSARVLVDRDGLVLYDLVLVCSCGRVFHHHTKEDTLKAHAELYQSAISSFEKLMQHYNQGAIISADKTTG